MAWSTRCTDWTFFIHPFSKDFAMTFNDPKTTATPAAPVKAA
jgi:hypothetical protein